MPDLWKALGDVYGEGQADRPPVRREPAASERTPADASADAGPGRFNTTLPLDDDLAAALSAALVNAPTPGSDAPVLDPVFQAPSPLAPPAPMVQTPPPVPSFAVVPAPPVAPPAPKPVAAPTTTSPVAAVPAAPAGEVQGRVSSWIAEIEDRNRRREEGPDLAAAVADGPAWSRTDDDIVPVARKRGRRK